MYIYLLLTLLLMLFIKDLLSGKRNSKNRQKNGEGPSSSQQELCEVSTLLVPGGHDHLFSPSSPRPLLFTTLRYSLAIFTSQN